MELLGYNKNSNNLSLGKDVRDRQIFKVETV